jgi:hypothetical protein
MWIPELFLLNRVDTIQPIGHDITFRASIYSDGQVSYVPGGILQAKCPTDISKFPFDTQECTLEIIMRQDPRSVMDLSTVGQKRLK